MFYYILSFLFNFSLLELSEQYFHNFIQNSMPIYCNFLSEARLLRFYTSNIPALINSSWCTIYGLYCWFFQVWDKPILPIAYFIHDIFHGCKFEMVFHHTAATVLILISTPEHYKIAPIILFTEASTIFLCLASILNGPPGCRRTLIDIEKIKLRNFKTCFVVTFFICRLILFPLQHLKNFNELKIMENLLLTALTVQNITWFFKIIKKIKNI